MKEFRTNAIVLRIRFIVHFETNTEGCRLHENLVVLNRFEALKWA